MEKKVKHKSVLLQEVIRFLEPKPGQAYIDATIGFGGHSVEILKKISSNGKLLGIDQDEEALAWLGANLRPKYPNLTLKKANYTDIGVVARESGFENANGILADIGVSSYQLDEAERGFSIKENGPLDMRMDKSKDLTAAEILNSYSESELTDIFSKYGEERLSRTIAQKIVEKRSERHFEATRELSELIESIYTKKGFRTSRIHPATKVFQALRIVVNDEIGSLTRFLPQAVDLLAPEGKLVIITFHSLEDRVVKRFFQEESKDCICPSELPECRCKHKKRLRIITKKPIVASKEEINENPRSRSAKMRVVERLK